MQLSPASSRCAAGRARCIGECKGSLTACSEHRSDAGAAACGLLRTGHGRL